MGCTVMSPRTTLAAACARTCRATCPQRTTPVRAAACVMLLLRNLRKKRNPMPESLRHHSVLFYMKMQLLEGVLHRSLPLPIPGVFVFAFRVLFDHHSHFASCGAGRTAAECCST